MINPVYIEVLKDSFLSNFIATVDAELAYPMVLMFGKHDVITTSIFAFIGSTGGLTATYGLFYALAVLMKKMLESNYGYPAAQHYTSKLAPIFGVFSALPQLSIIPAFFFGLTKMNFYKFLIVIAFYRAAYYIYALNTIHPLFAN